MTDAERKLWHHLRNRQLMGYKFIRQAPIGPYIADFLCRSHALVIEVDGGQHTEEKDVVRTEWLISRRYRVLRFWNTDVLKNLPDVLETIGRTLKKHPSP